MRQPWARSDTPPRIKLPPGRKRAILNEAEAFLTSYYRAECIKPPPPDYEFNYIVDFSVRWSSPYLRFVAKYACPGPNAISPSFETAFARLGCFAPDRFNLWGRRHNDRWFVVADRLALKGCFAEMRENPWFQMDW